MAAKKQGAETQYDKHRDGKFPDCRFCRYHLRGSHGIQCRYRHCPYRKRLEEQRGRR